MKYKEAKQTLTQSGKFYIDLGLKRVARILEILDNPQDKIKTIHIAGTNGKGSTSALFASILKEAGYKCGLYTSPHIVEYTERIKVNFNDISENDFSRLIEFVCNVAEKNKIHLTEFEILSVCAFQYFYEQNVDFAIIEVGLGGRLDATNVIKKPEICVITQIDLDHTERLGDTIEKIAFEKAGIIKKGSNIIINPKNPGYEVIKKAALNKNASVFCPSDKVELKFEQNKNLALINDIPYEMNLMGLIQRDNLGLVLEGLKHININYNENHIEKALKNVSWPCRMQFLKEENLIIDAAHNPNGIKALRESLSFYFKDQSFTFIFGCLKNKNYTEMLKTLIKEGDELIFCEFNYPNAALASDLNEGLSTSIQKIKVSDINKIKSDYPIVLCGSFYLIGEYLLKARNNNVFKTFCNDL